MITEQKFRIKKDGTPYSNCYCRTPNLIENYDKAVADDTQVWVCHHRLETHNSDGERRLVDISREELKVLGMYYDRPSEELIFLTKAEHMSLHHKGMKGKGMTGKHHSEETRKKMSESWKYDKHFSEETKKKMKQSLKGQHKGKHWFNNGEICTRCFDCPKGFVPGILRK